MVAAAGMFSLPLDYLRDMLANSSNFQTWTGTATAVAAKARTFVIGADDDETLPLAVVGWQSFARQSVGSGSRNHFEGSGPLWLVLIASAASDTEENEAFTFVNNVGAIIADVEALAGQAGYLDIRSIDLDYLERTEPNEDEAQTAGDTWQAAFTIDFYSGADS